MEIFDEEFEKKQKEYEQKTSKYFRENGNPLILDLVLNEVKVLKHKYDNGEDIGDLKEALDKFYEYTSKESVEEQYKEIRSSSQREREMKIAFMMMVLKWFRKEFCPIKYNLSYPTADVDYSIFGNFGEHAKLYVGDRYVTSKDDFDEAFRELMKERELECSINKTNKERG